MRQTYLNFTALLGMLLLSAPLMGQSRYSMSDIIHFKDRYDLEPAMMEVQYEMVKSDPLNGGEIQTDRMVLLIGPRYSLYCEYSRLQERLFLRSKGYKVTRGEWYAASDSLGVRDSYGTLYKDREKGTCRELAYAWGTYSYDEELPEIDWREVPDSMRTIGGYECRQAEADHRGRHWTVWYTPEVKISEGPYKLMGLPGLVLEAHSADGEIRIDFAALRKSDDPIVYDQEQYDHSFKGERKHFYRSMSQGKWRATETMEAAGLGVTDPDGNPVKPFRRYMFYVPMELDLVERPQPEPDK